MATLYALDTNVYIHALRDPAALAALKRFLLRTGLRVRVPGIVAMALRAGALTPAQEQRVEALIGAHASRGRTIAPSFAACVQAGRVLADLARHERMPVADAPRSLVADVLLAASCREADVTLVTGNHGDFARIARHLRGFRCTAPWPS